MTKSIKNFAFAINLRMFDGTNYNTQTTGSADLTYEMKVFYEKQLLTQAEPKLIHDQFALKKNIPAGGGKTIEFRKYSPLAKALTPLVEGVTPDGNNLKVGHIESTVRQYGDYITLSDILKLTAIDNNLVQATKLLAGQAGRTLDTVTRDVLVTGTNVIFATDVVNQSPGATGARHLLTAAHKFTPDLAFKAATTLKSMNAETVDNNSYVAILHPFVAYDLMRSSEWMSIKEYDPGDYYEGEIGKIGNVRFVESTEAKIWKGENLAGTTRNLAVNGAVTAGASYITFDGGTVEDDALIGRKLIIDGKVYTVEDNTSTKIYVEETLPAIEDNTVIYPGEGGKEGCAVFGVVVLGANAYATTAIEGGGLQHIFKPLGSAGAADPLDQRCSVGWKAMKTAEILEDAYMVRIECGSSYSGTAQAN